MPNTSGSDLINQWRMRSGDGFDELRIGSGERQVFGAEFQTAGGANIGFDGFEHIQLRTEIRRMVGAPDQRTAG